jgi:hypothetical protein
LLGAVFFVWARMAGLGPVGRHPVFDFRRAGPGGRAAGCWWPERCPAPCWHRRSGVLVPLRPLAGAPAPAVPPAWPRSRPSGCRSPGGLAVPPSWRAAPAPRAAGRGRARLLAAVWTGPGVRAGPPSWCPAAPWCWRGCCWVAVRPPWGLCGWGRPTLVACSRAGPLQPSVSTVRR